MRLVRLALLACLAASGAGAEEIVAPPDRDVTAPGMMPGNNVTGPLVRVPVPPPPPEPPRWRRYFLPATSDSGTFHVTGAFIIHVSDVDPPAADATCRLEDGTEWPCGRTALYSLRRFLHGRAVECFMAPPGNETEVVAPCRVGKTDIGQWLVANGWARAGGFPSQAALASEREARCAGRGIWRGAAPPANCPPGDAAPAIN